MEHYLTRKKLTELQGELEECKSVKRIEVAKRLKTAKELGDLSENSEYFEARDEQQFLETRIAELEDIIKNAKMIKMTSGGQSIGIGSTFYASKNGEDVKFTIVGQDEANPVDGFISNESPLGQAFLGKSSGDKVVVETPGGEVKYKIGKIE